MRNALTGELLPIPSGLKRCDGCETKIIPASIKTCHICDYLDAHGVTYTRNDQPDALHEEDMGHVEIERILDMGDAVMWRPGAMVDLEGSIAC